MNVPVKAPFSEPYADRAANFIYNLLFCDSLELYKEHTEPPHTYPFDILFTDTTSVTALQTLIDEPDADPRVKILAYNKLVAAGQKPAKSELLGIIVEVGLDGGLDVLAAFINGTARYINQTGKILVWETRDAASDAIIKELFLKSGDIISQIGPWDKPRREFPSEGNVRLTFLVSDGLYFGEGPIDILFNDPMAGPTLGTATELLQYLTEKAT